jgi:tetratricopeptide (TPR) repeat protein
MSSEKVDHTSVLDAARATGSRSDHAAAHFELANALRERNRGEESLPHYRQALAHEPASAQYLEALRRVLEGLGRLAEAVLDYEAALKAAPENVDLHMAAARLYRDLERYDAAIAQCEAAIKLAPDDFRHHLALGLWLREMGRLAEAEREMAKAYARNPGDVKAIHHLVLTRKMRADDPLLAALEARASGALTDDERIFLEFARGKAWSDLGEHARAFAAIERGNALKRKTVRYDAAAWFDRVESYRARFTPELMQRLAGQGDPSPVPIFIVGMPRSGSTLVEQILAGHPLVHAAGERPDFTRVADMLYGKNAPPNPSGATGVPRLPRLATIYLQSMQARAPNAARIIDKMLLNFELCGYINLALPNARIIHTRRNPIDTCLSCYARLFEGNNSPFSYDLRELGRYYRSYHELMAHWRRVLPPGMLLDVDYERVVDDVEGEARRIVAHCGLAWDESCLKFHEVDRAVRTASVLQVRQPIYRTSIRRWRPSGSAIDALVEGLGPELAALAEQPPA